MIPTSFAAANSLREKIQYVLSLRKRGSADEIAMEIMELQGMASEDDVADLIKETEIEINKMCEDGSVVVVKEHRQKKRFSMA